ncbi:MAG: WYL domain-containing protein [Paludibacter sp.]
MSESFDTESFFQDCYGIIQGENNVEKVILKFDSSQAKYIRALPLHHSQQEIETTAESVVFEYRIKPTFDFIQEILLHGDLVEVLAPASLRNKLIQISQKMGKMYLIVLIQINILNIFNIAFWLHNAKV